MTDRPAEIKTAAEPLPLLESDHRRMLEAWRLAFSDPAILAQMRPRGCICPVGAEATCAGLGCPRRAYHLR